MLESALSQRREIERENGILTYASLSDVGLYIILMLNPVGIIR